MTSLEELQVEHKQITKFLGKVQREVESLLAKQEELLERKALLESEIDRHQCSSNERNIADPQWSSEEFEWSDKLRDKLQNVFQIQDYRAKQLEAINATLSDRDVLLIMSTGGGKSLCYQLPAIVSHGLTLVVSPLISLMEDQTISLQKYGIEAVLLNAETPKEVVKGVYQTMTSKAPKIKLLYVTPEKISKSKRFMAQLEKCYKAGNLTRIAIDEVHCTSQWGNDFRPDYKILGILKKQFPKTPILGLTATATSKVVNDIKKMLNIPFALLFKTQLNRSNLFYKVRVKPKTQSETIADMVAVINENFMNKSGIVYCFSRKDCSEVSGSLNKSGIKSAVYHAYLPNDVKSKVHKMWIDGGVQVICATVAFGMGINKPDVRFVIHHSISKSAENYYQESGRAGRDGQHALCLLYFGFSDIFRQSSMVLTERTGLDKLSHMISYCHNLKKCRRNLLAHYFGESWDSVTCNQMCDACQSNATGDVCNLDITEHCRAILDVVKTAESLGDGNRVTGLKVVEGAAGRGKCKTSNKTLKAMDAESVQRIIIYMLLNNYLKEDFHFTPYSTISYLIPGPLSSNLTQANVRIDMPAKGSKNLKEVYSTQPLSEFMQKRTSTTKSSCKKRPRPNLSLSGVGNGATSSVVLDDKPSKLLKRHAPSTSLHVPIVIDDSD
ncbi:ATP-dependent DNA helicase Q1-like isoform X2 [Clavelina lepadiformis]